MELERPKQKKKSKKKYTVDETATERQPVLVTLADVDVDTAFPSTSICDDIPSQECFIAAATEELLTITDTPNDADEEEAVDNDLHESPECTAPIDEDCESVSSTIVKSVCVPTKETLEVESEPSAPPDDVQVTKQMLERDSTVVHYPNLQQLQNELKHGNIKATAVRAETEIVNVTLQPFTAVQLRELYTNPEVELAAQFEEEFVNAELSANYKVHPLYELLSKYSRLRHNLKMNDIDLQQAQQTFASTEVKLWTREIKTLKYSGLCEDGVSCSGTEKYDFYTFNEPAFDTAATTLNDILNLVCFSYTTNLYSADIHKNQIEQRIRELAGNIVDVVGLHPQSPVSLRTNVQPTNIEPIRELRLGISILFHFLRRSTPDKIFANDVKQWLQKLVSCLLRTATWQDHLFLIHHVLRCPAGVSDWATSFIQIPRPPRDLNVSPFASNEIHHCIAFLRTLLLPIANRDEFLVRQIKETGSSTVVDPVKEDLWILVDSDGEEDSADSDLCMALKEKDLIAFLNQIPLEHMFSSITFAQRKNDRYVIYEDFITGHHLLKFIAFSSHFVELLGDGLGTYDTERYKQFAKMLSRLIRHTVLYLSDMHAIFKSNGIAKDGHLCARIQVEFDTFVLRASHFIYKSQFLGAWQYLAILPFSDLCIRTVWKLYYFLVAGSFEGDITEQTENDFEIKFREFNFLTLFNDTVIDVPVEDMYYLLQTFSSMAMSRSRDHDYAFIERITLDLFAIGFANEPTNESCYKIVRDLLVNITTTYPALISSILLTLKNTVQTTDNGGVYLFKSLPLDRWHPTPTDFEISATWLLNFGFETAESSLARTMFSRLNWNFTADASELFLSHDLHMRMACLIVEVAAKHVPETAGLSGISESVRQVSNLVKGQSPKQQFTTWCWNMVTVLRLHSLDQTRDHRIRIMRNPVDAMRATPDLERLQSVHQGVADRRPIALYLSVLCTAWGHSVPQICHKGFQQMLLLNSDYRHSIVIRCLQLIAPLFIECPESLSKCDKFQMVLQQLLAADRTYMKMAKDLITTDFPGPVVEMLGHMIQAQCIDHYNYGFVTPTLLLNVWLQCITEMPNWTKDMNAIYIVDLLLRIAFQSPETWCQSKEYFRFLYMKAESDPKQNKATSFLPFLGGGSQPTSPLPTPSPNALWLAFITLELEHDIFELQTQLWPELLRQMEGAALKCSIDHLIKKSASALSCASCPAASLVLYKLANLIILCPHDHPLVPIVCQRFFSLYLARVNLTEEEERYTDTYGVADKFYEYNVSLMKKLKKYLIATETYFNQESLKADDDLRTQFLSSCCRLFHSFTLWLEETRLNKMRNLQQIEFPPQYDANRLAMIFARNDTYWTEFLLLSDIRDAQKEAANNWLKTCFRFVPVRPLRSMASVDGAQRPDAKENIFRHLQTYDDPVPPPDIRSESLLIASFQPSDVQRRILPILKSDFKLLEDAAKAFNNTLQELNYTNCNYKDLIRLLYANEERSCERNVQCSSMYSSSSSCKGSQSVRIVVSDPVLNVRVKSKVENNRQAYKAIVDRQTSAPSQAIVMAIVKTQHNVRQILDMYQTAKSYDNDRDQLSAVGIAFFYDIVNSINELMNVFPPSNELLTDVISHLGIFIRDNQNTEGIRLLHTALRRPHLLQMISEIFTPWTTAPVYFLEMYKFVVESHMKKCDPKVLFVLLSKFDVCKWLNTFRPKLADINQLLKLILQGLESWNQADAVLLQGSSDQ